MTNLEKICCFVLPPEFGPISVFESAIAATITVGALGLPAGFPSPAVDNLEDEIDPIAWVGRRPGSTFWYRAYGDCLANIGILDAERIAFDRSSKKRFERVMVFVVDGAFTAKCSIKEHLRGAPVYDTTRHLKFLSRGAAHGVYAATVTEITI